jgi:hypothetical protein
MCNFGYLAFSLNRLSLIGKDHGKVVKFMSEVGFKTYIGVTFLISSIFSVIKYFRYHVNEDQPTSNYPISNEFDLFVTDYKTNENINLTHAYFIINSISDIINYVIFVIVCAILDVYMVIRLKRTIDEKMNSAKSTSQTSQVSNKKEESKDKKKKKEKEDPVHDEFIFIKDSFS